LLVYDVTKEKSFDNISRWMDELKHQAEPDIVIILVGNKVD
jgi:Rab family protein